MFCWHSLIWEWASFCSDRQSSGRKFWDGIKKISAGELAAQIPMEQISGDNRVFAEAVNQMGSGLSAAVEK